MTPEEEKAWRGNDEHERIGDPARVKWTAFLNRALVLRYITIAEFTERMEAVQEAATMKDIFDAVHIGEFGRDDLEAWSKAWGERRRKGLEPKSEILPEVARSGAGLIDALFALALVAFVLTVVYLAVR